MTRPNKKKQRRNILPAPTPKNMKVTEDTQVHLTTTYTRRKPTETKSRAESIKRSFSFVIKGMLISSALVGSLIGTGVLGNNTAYASSADIKPLATQEYTIKEEYRDEAAMIQNLKNATKILDTAIKRGEFSETLYESVMNKLASIEAKLMVDGVFNKQEDLLTAITSTDTTLKTEINEGATDTILVARQKSIDVLTRIQETLNVSKKSVDGVMAVQGLAVSAVVPNLPRTEVVAAVTANKSRYPSAVVQIDGKIQQYPQSAVVIEGNTMVPMRGIFEALGAKVKWDPTTQTVTGTKGDTVIQLKIGDKYALVNGKKISITAPARVINGSTLVPLRFISETLGAKVSWDQNSNTVSISSQVSSEKPTTPTKPVEQAPSKNISTTGAGYSFNVAGLEIRYGNHTYGSKTQAEYDYVMKQVDAAIAATDFTQIPTTYSSHKQLLEYMDGARFDPNVELTHEAMMLKSADGMIGQLVKAGVSKETIIKALTASALAKSMTKGTSDPLDGSPNSAYHVLVDKRIDCDAESQLYIAIFDALGFNTAIVGIPGDAAPIVEINGVWYSVGGGSFRETTLPTSTNTSASEYLYAKPTNA